MNPIVVPAPASKSLSHRTLIAAALADGISRLSGLLESDDTTRTREILTAFGAGFRSLGPGAYEVTGLAGKVEHHGAEPLSCFVGESGTTCRLLPAVAAAGKGAFRFHGAGRMHQRPIKELTDALHSLGAGIRFEGETGNPPIAVEARGLDAANLPEREVVVGCDESSQYLSGLLLAAPLGRGLRIRLGGAKAVSWPYVSLTLDTLERFGITFRVETRPEGEWLPCAWRSLREGLPGRVRFVVEPGMYRAGAYAVEGDWSGASYFLAAGAIGPRPVRVEGLNPNSLQGDAALVEILRLMGARVDLDAAGVLVSPASLRGVDVDMGHCPDLVPTVAALAAHAEGETRVRNVAHLRIKESDRLAAPAEELAKVGCAVTILDDGLIVAPPAGGPRKPAEGVIFSAHHDHRMAMSVSLLGLPGLHGQGFAVPVDNQGCTAKSFPHFWNLWERVLA